MKFEPVFRIAVMSDIHIKTDRGNEAERFERGMLLAYNYAASQDYKNLDALFVVGDFANRGQEDEMQLFKTCLEKSVKSETQTVMTLASHEFMSEGVEPAYEKLGRIYGKKPDEHKVINGFHCISMSCDKGCAIYEEKQNWLKAQLEIAAKDDPKKPIFVFQHPHLSGTVYGSINWGEDDIISILMDYPQVVDFSGHSHAPVNDPRSIHQKYFTSFGTGSLSYFELDEFDYLGGTVPQNSSQCAQFLIVEADKDGRVLVKPLDILSGKFFNDGALIEKPYEPESFVFTENRRFTAEKPVFDKNTKVDVGNDENGVTLSFEQAGGKERVDCYTVCVREKFSGIVKKQITETSSYYLYDMPKTMSLPLGRLENGKYTVKITANGFWGNVSEPLTAEFEVKND